MLKTDQQSDQISHRGLPLHYLRRRIYFLNDTKIFEFFASHRNKERNKRSNQLYFRNETIEDLKPNTNNIITIIRDAATVTDCNTLSTFSHSSP